MTVAKLAAAIPPAADEGEAPLAPLVPDLITGGRLLDTDYPPVAYAIDPICPMSEVCEWSGAHGVFKSTLALKAVLDVVTGRRFGALPVKPGRGAFVTLEDSQQTIARRSRAYLESIPLGEERRRAEKAIRAGFTFLAREDVRGMALTLTEFGQAEARAAVVERLTEVLTGNRIAVLETSARLMNGDENSNATQAVFAMALEDIAQKAGLALILVRHVSKGAALEERADSYAGRGGGALSDAARSVVTFVRPSPKNGDEQDPMRPVFMYHPKGTHSRPADRIAWQPVEVPGVGVYMRAMSDDETVRANARRLLATIGPEGITVSEIHKRRHAGLSRQAAKDAFEFLIETGMVAEGTRPHGNNRQPVTVYRPAEGKE